MLEMLRRAGRAAAWGVATVVFGAAAGVAWDPTPRPESRTVLAWVFTVLAALTLYLCLAESFGRWRMRRRRGIDLALETVGTSTSRITVLLPITSPRSPVSASLQLVGQKARNTGQSHGWTTPSNRSGFTSGIRRRLISRYSIAQPFRHR